MDVGKEYFTKFSGQTASATQKNMKWEGGQNQIAYINEIEKNYAPLTWPTLKDINLKDKGICKTLCIEWLKFIILDECSMEKMYHFSEYGSSVDDFYGSIQETWAALDRISTMQTYYAWDWYEVQKSDKKDLRFYLTFYDKKESDRTIKDVEEALIKQCSNGKMKLRSFNEKINTGEIMKFFSNQVFGSSSPRYFILGLYWEKDAHAIAGVVNSNKIAVYDPDSGVYKLFNSDGMEQFLCQMSSSKKTVEYYMFSEIAATDCDCGCGCCEIA